MGSEDFIDLDSPCDSDHRNAPENTDFTPNEADCKNDSSFITESIPAREDGETLNMNNQRDGIRYMDTMDSRDDSMKQPVLEENIEMVEFMTTLEMVSELEQDKMNGCSITHSNSTVKQTLIDESPIAGVKRARMTLVDQEPSVRVVYNSLTRESKKKLMELMHQWSEWHSQHQSPSNISLKEDLECGEETYFPALHVGSDTPYSVSFWLDNGARKEESTDIRLDNDLVPLYDRGYLLVSTSVDGLGNHESGDASRCFNCGSYSHSLKECTKPRDNVAISNARKQHNAKRNPAGGSRGQVRYYQKTPGKFDDLKAGVLGAETRESLGIGEFDPPPWLHRMREMGYPPGYIEVVEDGEQPSGITIFSDEETKEEYEEGELPERGEPVPPEKKMTVEFPGINAPIPENADHRRWSTPSAGYSDSSSFKSRSNSRSNHSSDPHRGYHHDHRWSSGYQDDGPPGSEHGLAASLPGYTPRYSSYDHNPIPRSPSLGRSLSDRGRRSPLPYESSPSHSPHGQYSYHYAMTQQSSHYPNQSPGHEQQNKESSYGGSSDVSSQQVRDRHEHRHHHSRK